MKIHIFSVAAIAFCFAAASLSLSGGAEAGDVRLGQACKKIDQIIAPIEEQRKKIRDEWWPKQREVWTIDENAELEMEKIQVQKRRLKCTTVKQVYLDRSTLRECTRLTKKRMDILREKEEKKLALSREMEPLKQQLDLIDVDLPRLYKTKTRCDEARLEREQAESGLTNGQSPVQAYTDEYIRNKGWTRISPDEERRCAHEMACLDKKQHPRELAQCGSSGTGGVVIQNRSSHNGCIAKDCPANTRQTIDNNFGQPVKPYPAIFPTYECKSLK